MIGFSDDGVPRPATIELHESSGPVSPRFQYQLDVTVKAGASGVRLHKGSEESDLPLERYRELWSQLEQNNVLAVSGALSDELRKRVGVSVNTFALQLDGGAAVRFEYQLSQLAEPQYAARAGIVAAMKQLTER